jgi:hypothetical protein
MCGAISMLSNRPQWNGAQLKKSTGTTLPLPVYAMEYVERYFRPLILCNLIVKDRGVYFSLVKFHHMNRFSSFWQLTFLFSVETHIIRGYLLRTVEYYINCMKLH